MRGDEPNPRPIDHHVQQAAQHPVESQHAAGATEREDGKPPGTAPGGIPSPDPVHRSSTPHLPDVVQRRDPVPAANTDAHPEHATRRRENRDASANYHVHSKRDDVSVASAGTPRRGNAVPALGIDDTATGGGAGGSPHVSTPQSVKDSARDSNGQNARACWESGSRVEASEQLDQPARSDEAQASPTAVSIPHTHQRLHHDQSHDQSLGSILLAGLGPKLCVAVYRTVAQCLAQPPAQRRRSFSAVHAEEKAAHVNSPAACSPGRGAEQLGGPAESFIHRRRGNREARDAVTKLLRAHNRLHLVPLAVATLEADHILLQPPAGPDQV